MNASELIRSVEAVRHHFGPHPYDCWYVGLTDDPVQRRQQHGGIGSTPCWRVFPTESEAVARAVEKIFISLGMRGGPGGAGSAYLYVY